MDEVFVSWDVKKWWVNDSALVDGIVVIDFVDISVDSDVECSVDVSGEVGADTANEFVDFGDSDVADWILNDSWEVDGDDVTDSVDNFTIDSDVVSWSVNDSGEVVFDVVINGLNNVSGGSDADVRSVGDFVEVVGDVVNANEDCGSVLYGCLKKLDTEGDTGSVKKINSNCLSWNCRHVKYIFLNMICLTCSYVHFSFNRIWKADFDNALNLNN